MMMYPYQKRTWANIELDAAKHNYQTIRNRLSKGTKLCCVVKANAYGHGAVQLSKLYEKLGADYLAVSNIEEAIQLRNNNITLPILILGYTDPRCASELAVHKITQCVFSYSYGESLSKYAVEQGVVVKIHIKIDTGMGRIGFQCLNEELDMAEQVCKMPGLVCEGIFTHFSSADEGESGRKYTLSQFERFMTAIRYLETKGIMFAIRHCANSAAIFDYPEMHLDMVRAGIVLYGLKPSPQMSDDYELRPVLQLETIVDFVKEVHKNDSISYGCEFVAKKDLRIATLPVGYADGLWRSNYKNDFFVEINGKYARVVGRICMDQCMVDITGIEDVEVGSKVIVYSVSGENSVDRIAQKNSTINYEILCAIGERVPRIYVKDKEIVDIQDNIVKGYI